MQIYKSSLVNYQNQLELQYTIKFAKAIFLLPWVVLKPDVR